MRLKIKYTSTKKFVLNFNGSTVGELTEAVKAFVADSYGETCSDFVLSLNGREPLTGTASTALSDLGIVASDMLTVLPGTAAAAGGGGAAANSSGASGAAANSSGANGTSGVRSDSTGSSGSAIDTGNGSAGERNQPQQLSDGDAKGGAAVASSPIVFAPTTLLEVSNDVTTAQDGGSSSSTLPASLQSLLAHCQPKDAGQLVNLLAHITMLECDFKAPNSSDIGPSSTRTTPPPSPGWDGLVASLNYEHKNFPSFSCSLVLVAMGDTKQMLVSFPGQDVEISTKVNVWDYVEGQGTPGIPIEVASLRNVSRLAKHLRNELLVPLQLAAHRILDVPSPRHLAGLPTELLFMVLKHLDARSVLRLARCCKRLQSEATDDIVWRLLYNRDFGDSPPSLDVDPVSGDNIRDLTNWLARYKNRELKQRARYIGWQFPSSQLITPQNIIPSPHPQIYPTGPLYPEFPNRPQPMGPYPVVPDPTPPFNPYGDPDSPYYGGDLPFGPPQPYSAPNPLGPLHGGGPRHPFRDPLNPFGIISSRANRRNRLRGSPRGGLPFRFI